MKKIIAVIVLAFSILACGQFLSPQQLATQTAVAADATSVASTAVALASTATAASWTPVPTSTPAIDYSGDLGIFSAQIYDGPGTDYPVTFLFSGKVTIVGQAYQCAWFKVVSNSDPTNSGWISADKLSYSLQCSDVQEADFTPAPTLTSTDTPVPPTDTPIPPTNTPLPLPVAATSAPSAPSAPSVSCLVNSNIIISNRSGAPFTIYLTGPGSFTFSIGASEHTTEKVCSGSYNYTIYGTCNGNPASGSGRISDGDQVAFMCK